ncbi:MAG: S8 family serine peptidase, partial [Clostridia bacterium]|nr:S8 family serine peptidase [Clostridia bacterium]
TTIQGSFNMWLPIKKLMNSETFFLDSDPFTTLLEPAADERVISIGSYNHVTGGPDIDSGRGYSANGTVKPDVVAPGVNVSWPVEGESVQSAEGPIRVMSGTSVAAAHVAGMAALLLQWGVTDGNDRLMGNNQVKSILARGAVRNVNALQEGVTYPDPVSGYGKVNIMDSFIQLRIN